MALTIYKWGGNWLRRAAYPDANSNPGWALAVECCCQGCQFCVPDCGTGNIVVTFHSATCAELDGITRTLSPSTAFVPPAEGLWIYENEADECFGDCLIAITKDCSICQDGVGAYVLTVVSSCHEVNESACGDTVNSTCDPFYLVYEEMSAMVTNSTINDCPNCDCDLDPKMVPQGYAFYCTAECAT